MKVRLKFSLHCYPLWPPKKATPEGVASLIHKAPRGSEVEKNYFFWLLPRSQEYYDTFQFTHPQGVEMNPEGFSGKVMKNFAIRKYFLRFFIFLLNN